MIKLKSCHGKASSWLQGTVNLWQEAPGVTGVRAWPPLLWARLLTLQELRCHRVQSGSYEASTDCRQPARPCPGTCSEGRGSGRQLQHIAHAQWEGLRFQLCCLPALWPYARHLTSLSHGYTHTLSLSHCSFIKGI